MSSKPRKLVSTSKDSATGEAIVLSENESFRLVFKPEVVNNEKNTEACVRGKFVKQRKTRNAEWQDTPSFPASKLLAGEEINLPLSSEEVYALLTGLHEYKDYFKQKGIPWGEDHFVVTDGDAIQALKQLSQLSSLSSIAELMPRLASGELNRVSNVVGYMQLVSTLEEIQEGLAENNNEEWWQRKLLEAPWVLGQLFTQPVVMLEDKAHVGGKDIENSGGKVADYLFQNELTGNVAIIEIKTPQTSLLQSREYRSRIYGLSDELSGALVQSLTYGDTLSKEYTTLANNSNKAFTVFRPQCVIIAGKTIELSNKWKIRSFELQRSSHKDVEIVTFDELAHRCSALLRLMQLGTVEGEVKDGSDLPANLDEYDIGDLEPPGDYNIGDSERPDDY